MSQEPPVTAIVVTNHRPQQLRAAIDAILAQRYEGEIECVVVFNGETPNPGLERRGPSRSVRVMANERKPGLPGARNSGILAARGEYVALCDDDDLWLPDRLARGIERLERDQDCDVVAGPIRLHWEDRDVDRGHEGARIEFGDLLRDRIVAAHTSTLVVRRAAYEEVGLVDETAPGGYAEDYDWLLRAARRKPIAFLAGPPVAIVDRRGSKFADWEGIDRGIAFLLARHPELKRDRRGRARLLGRRAFAHAAIGDRRAALGFARRSLAANPLERRALLSVLIAAGLLSADRVQRMAFARGRTA